MSTPPSAPSAAHVAIHPLTDRERRNYASFARDALKQGAPQTLTLARIIQEYEATLDALSSRSAEDRSDTERLDWMEAQARSGRILNVMWWRREKSTIEEMIPYDIPAGYYLHEDDAPQPTLRDAIDAARTASPRESHE